MYRFILASWKELEQGRCRFLVFKKTKCNLHLNIKLYRVCGI